MEVLVDRGAGIDVHKKSVTVCVMTSEGRTAVKTLQQFSTFHRGLMEMRDALARMGVTHVAMEATGEYWKPVYEVLEGSFELVVANAQHVKECSWAKNRPGGRGPACPVCSGMGFDAPALSRRRRSAIFAASRACGERPSR